MWLREAVFSEGMGAFDSHKAWLVQMRSEYEEMVTHERRRAERTSEDASDEQAVGSGRDSAADEAQAELQEPSPELEELDFGTPVYRTLSLSADLAGDAESSPDAHAAWLASARPPLLTRQNAFSGKRARHR